MFYTPHHTTRPLIVCCCCCFPFSICIWRKANKNAHGDNFLLSERMGFSALQKLTFFRAQHNITLTTLHLSLSLLSLSQTHLAPLPILRTPFSPSPYCSDLNAKKLSITRSVVIFNKFLFNFGKEEDIIITSSSPFSLPPPSSFSVREEIF